MHDTEANKVSTSTILIDLLRCALESANRCYAHKRVRKEWKQHLDKNHRNKVSAPDMVNFIKRTGERIALIKLCRILTINKSTAQKLRFFLQLVLFSPQTVIFIVQFNAVIIESEGARVVVEFKKKMVSLWASTSSNILGIQSIT